MTLNTSLISKHSIVWLSGQQTLLPTETACSPRNGVPTKGEEWFLCPFVLTRWEMVQLVPTKAILQPAKLGTMCTACLEYDLPPLPPPSPPLFLLVYKPLKRIVPTDNKSDNTKRHHQWLKGQCGSNSSGFVWLIISHCSLRNNDLTATGAITLARALQHNKSLEELK